MLKKGPHLSRKAPPDMAPDHLEEALEALEEKHDAVYRHMRNIMDHLEDQRPDSVMDDLLSLDKEIRTYRRFFQILKAQLLAHEDSAFALS